MPQKILLTENASKMIVIEDKSMHETIFNIVQNSVSSKNKNNIYNC